MRATDSKSIYVPFRNNQLLQPKLQQNTSSSRFQFNSRGNYTRKKSNESISIVQNQNDSARKMFSPNFFKSPPVKDTKPITSLEFGKTPKSPVVKNLAPSSPDISKKISSLNLPNNLRHTIDCPSQEYRIKPLSKQRSVSIDSQKIIGQSIKLSQQNTVLKAENQRLKGIIHKLIEGEYVGGLRLQTDELLQNARSPTKVLNNSYLSTSKPANNFDNPTQATSAIMKTIKQILKDFKRVRSVQQMVDKKSITALLEIQLIKTYVNQLMTEVLRLRNINEQNEHIKQQLIHFKNKIESDKAIRDNILKQIAALKQRVNSEHKQKQQLLVQINELKLDNNSSHNRIKELQSEISFYQNSFRVQDNSEAPVSSSMFKFNLQPIPLIRQRPRKGSVQEIEAIMSQIHESQSFIENDPIDSVKQSYEKRITGMKQDYQNEISRLNKQLREVKETSRAYSTMMDSAMEKSIIFKDLWKKKDEEYESMRQLIVKLRQMH